MPRKKAPPANPSYPIIMRLFQAAQKADGFELAKAALRVAGLEDANWDPFEQSSRVLAAYERAGIAAERRKDAESALIFELLSYCHAVEMTAVHDLLWNVLHIAAGGKCKIDPFNELAREQRRKKNKPPAPGAIWVMPLSAKERYMKIKELARRTGFDDLATIIDHAFNEDVRNGVNHSDFVLIRGAFRTRHGRHIHELTAEQVQTLLAAGHHFVTAILGARVHLLRTLIKVGTREIAPGVFFQYIGTDGQATGFESRDATGKLRCRFNRTASGVDVVNAMPKSDWTLEFWL